jgi:integrase
MTVATAPKYRPRSALQVASDVVAECLKTPERKGRRPVDNGLYLQTTPRASGGATYAWIFRFKSTTTDTWREMGLGNLEHPSLRALSVFGDLTVKEAMDEAEKLRVAVREKKDPIDVRNAERRANNETRVAKAAALTFKQCAVAFHGDQKAAWKNDKHAAQWLASLETHAYPTLGALLAKDVDMARVLATLKPIWTERTETASRVRGRIEAVLDWATVHGHRAGPTPARWKGHLDKLLPAPAKVAKVKHHDALPAEAMGAFMKRLRAADGMGALALEFAILTAARSGEVRLMTTAEVDTESKMWTVPAERMKAKKEHRVPLTDAALAVLTKAKTLAEGITSDFVFPAVRGGALSDMTLSAVTRRMEVAAVPHGFRSTFRDWIGDHTEYPGDLAEMALAHTVSDKVEAAYRRSDMVAKRRAMMADWAAFLDVVPTPKEATA